LETICWGCPPTMILLFSASQVDRFTGMGHQFQLTWHINGPWEMYVHLYIINQNKVCLV
jgi:hypothetical protein